MPTISAIMPVYNAEKYVKETINSVLNQTFADFELIIVNDGSTDSTREIIEQFKDDRIRLFNLKTNQGVGYASNFAVKHVQGKYVARVDSDDIYHKDRFLLQKLFLDEHPELALVKSLVKYFSDPDVEHTERYRILKEIVEKDKNSVITPEEIREKLYWNMCIPHTSMMIRTEVIKHYGYKNVLCGEDYYLLYELNKAGFKMGTVTDYLVKVRVSKNSTTARKQAELFKTVFQIKEDIIKTLFEQGKVFLWGAGSFGKQVLEILERKGFDIEGFIDSDIKKIELSINGKKVFLPNAINLGGENKVIITSQTGRNAIVNILKEQGLQHLQDYIVYY